MDRIDIHLDVQRVPYQKLEAAGTGEPPTVIRARVEAARKVQAARSFPLWANLPFRCGGWESQSSKGFSRLARKCRIMPKGRSQKVGKLGEDTLAAWAHQVDFTITKPTEDEQGWDFLLEAEPPDLSANPLRASYDRRSFPAKFWIQVKTTDDKPGSWQVKLDNWERLVKTPYPAFFLTCEFDGKDTCQRAYLYGQV